MEGAAPHGPHHAAYAPQYVPFAYNARPPGFYAAAAAAAAASQPSARTRAVQRVAAAAETAWLQISSAASVLGMHERALGAADVVLAHNPASAGAHVRMGCALHALGQFGPAAEHFQKALALPGGADGAPGTWAALAHCLLLLEDLPRAFHAYQQALSFPGGPHDGALWLGVGLLYDRYGADAHALEAFGAALRAEHREDAPPTPVAREAYYRVALLLRARGRYAAAAETLAYLAVFPPAPLRASDMRVSSALTRLMAVDAAREADECARLYASETGRPAAGVPDAADEDAAVAEVSAVLAGSPGGMAGVLGAWAIASRPGDATGGALVLQLAAAAPRRAPDAPAPRPDDALLFYFAGRVHMRRRAFAAAYEAYQEAVFRDGQNAAFWNSIGILYLEIRQFRDALDAFSRAVHLAPGAWQLWWNLGVLYEQCNNQTADAADAYRRAQEHAGPLLGAFIGRRLSDIAAAEPPAGGAVPAGRVFELDALAFVPRPISVPPRRA